MIFVSGLTYCFAQGAEEGILILREAKQYGKTNVSAQAYLKDDILEVRVGARVYGDKPKIDNVLVVGPKLGRLSAKAKTTIYASEEAEAEIAVSESRGVLGFGARSEVRKKKGVLVREQYKFKIPKEKMVSGKRYELRIKIDSPKIDSKSIRFKFLLKDLARHILEEDNP